MPDPWREPFASSERVQRKMSNLARRDTGPELRLRRELHRLGLRYYVHRRPLSGLRREADIVFPKARVAVFVDGCFWHGCPDHGRRLHRTNGWYWPEKIERNKARDCDTDLQLERAGWSSVRVWEHDNHEVAAQQIAETVASRSIVDW
jgi:DNA mismatch endonuclease (patch repair protein)